MLAEKVFDNASSSGLNLRPQPTRIASSRNAVPGRS